MEDEDGFPTILVGEKDARHYVETFWLGMRIYRGLISNLFDVKVPLFCGHKLNLQLQSPMQNVPLLEKIHSKIQVLEQEKAILKQIYDSGACGIAFEGGEPLLRKDLGGNSCFFSFSAFAYKPNN